VNPLLGFLIGQGVIFGASAGFMPGPLHGFLINTTLKSGWRRALLVVIAPLIVDIPIILAVLFALEALAGIVPTIVDGIRVAGGLFVLYIAYGVLQDFRANIQLDDVSKQGPQVEDTARATFVRGLGVNALNPSPYIFWSTVLGPLLQQGLATSTAYGVAFLFAFYGTFLSLLTLIAVGFDRLRRLDPRITRGLYLVIALLLTLIALYLIVIGLQGLLG
jgi:threonine/homoserine/homoserine lactone efflux protein